MTTSPVVAFDHVSFAYHHNRVLDDITFTIEQGAYVGILGPNGGGKTTLLKLLLGLQAPASGTVRLFGEEPTPRACHRIGYVPQTAAQKDWHFPATVAEVVASGITPQKKIFSRLSPADTAAMDDAMEIVGITGLKKKLIEELSGGQRQRVFIARALAAQPDMLILDEPTVGVDMAAQETFYTCIKQLHTEKQMTILFVSHDIDVIAHEAEQVLCVNTELICHVPANEAITSGVLEKMYGEKGKYILHKH